MYVDLLKGSAFAKTKYVTGKHIWKNNNSPKGEFFFVGHYIKN